MTEFFEIEKKWPHGVCLQTSTSGLDPLKILDSYTAGFQNGRAFDKLAAPERHKLEAAGLVSGRRSLFESCVVFPLYKNGRVTTIYGRKTVADAGRHYMLSCKREGLYLPKQGLNPQRPVIITESIIDALSLFTAGITNVLPLLGINGFLPDHLAYLKEQAFPGVFVALNGDNAGKRAAVALKERLASEQIPAQIITLPNDSDINDMLRELGSEKLKDWVKDRTTTNQYTGEQWTGEDGATYVLYEDREYRLSGLAHYGMDRLRVNIKVYRINNKSAFYIDTLDLYQSRSREHFTTQTAREIKVEPAKVARDINGIITILEELRLRKKEKGDDNKACTMSESDRREALEYLRSPDLLGRIAKDFESCGMVGNTNVNVLTYLGALSRLTEHPFGTLIVSRSGAGKSFLQDMVASFTPEESLLNMTRLTGQSLFYQGKGGLKHKLGPSCTVS